MLGLKKPLETSQDNTFYPRLLRRNSPYGDPDGTTSIRVQPEYNPASLGPGERG